MVRQLKLADLNTYTSQLRELSGGYTIHRYFTSRNCFNHLASVKLNKSYQTKFQCNFTDQTYSPSSSALPSLAVSVLFVSVLFVSVLFVSVLFAVPWFRPF